MRWTSWLRDWLLPETDLAAGNRESASARFSRSEALALIEQDPLFRHPAAARQRAEMLALIGGPFGVAAHARCLALVREAAQAQDYPVRPGTAEELWALEGLFDRLLKP